MDILLIFPRIEHGITSYKDKNSWRSILFGYPIITLPHLATITPKRHRVNILNENYEAIDFTEDCDLVGITAYTMTAPRAYEIADEFRKRGKKVVLGGYHPTALPFEAIQHCDSVVQGWAETVWPQLLDDVDNNKMKAFYKSDDNFSLDDIPMLRRDLITHNPLLGAVQTTRGCLYHCEFCAIGSFSNHKVYQRPINNVIEEIKQMPNRIFIFHDPHLTV
ncbi:MAG: cobalamin-dependent protein, partial [Candidatus Thermoplasmatota archaeon]|nr:cobalamin-dependent protein [Candidatus Thermoplasmatota archaeon]